MPGEEDFGITAVEAIASGKAVIALGRGGVREIVPEEGAFFYDSPDEGSLDAAIAAIRSGRSDDSRGAITDRRRSDSPRPNSIAKCERYCISMSSRRIIRAPRGRELRCKGWRQEGALRMLMNNLDPEVAERPDDLIVYGGTGRAARSWEAFDAIVRSLESLENDETLAGGIGQARGNFSHARRCAARADRECEPGGPLVELERISSAGAAWVDDVRADDGGVVDLHRQPGNRPGNV